MLQQQFECICPNDCLSGSEAIRPVKSAVPGKVQLVPVVKQGPGRTLRQENRSCG